MSRTKLNLPAETSGTDITRFNALHAAAEHGAVEDVEGGEQRGRAVAFVIVGHGAGAALLQRQARLGGRKLKTRCRCDAARIRSPPRDTQAPSPGTDRPASSAIRWSPRSATLARRADADVTAGSTACDGSRRAGFRAHRFAHVTMFVPSFTPWPAAQSRPAPPATLPLPARPTLN